MIDHSLFFAASPDMLAVVDDGLRIAAANPAWTARLGAVGGLDEVLHADDRAVAVAHIAALVVGEQATVGARLRTRDGGHTVCDLRCVRGAAGGVHVIVRERSGAVALRAEAAEATSRLAAVMACMHDIVLLTDEPGNIVMANRAPPGLSMADMVGTPMLAFAAPEEQAPMQARWDRLVAGGALESYDTRAIYPDGTLADFTSRMGAIREGDQFTGAVLITREVTRERRAEEAKRHAEAQLREYMTQLERSNRELERFASVASHDLQEPLRKIQAFSDRLRDKFHAALPDVGRDYLERICSAARRMQDLINDLLMFSRLSARDQTYGRVHLGKVARTVLSDLEVRVEETGGKVVLGELPTIDADAVHMRQLLQNMIGNALKFTRPGVPPVVTVDAEVVQSPGVPGGLLRLRFADNGIGIEARHHDRIFGIFERLHGRGKYEGTGVGLAVCRKIVEQHHGSITIESVVGEGTTFTVLLPVHQPERSAKR